jgi:hypothetical protein
MAHDAYEAFPDGLVFHAVDLEPDPGSIVRGAARPPGLLADRVRFGGPQVTVIDQRYRADDQDLQAFLANAAETRFVLALMAVDFPPSDGPDLANANVTVTLRDDREQSKAIAHSVIPIEAGSPFEVSSGYTIDSSLKIGAVGLGAGGKGESVDHGQRTYVRGGGEFSATPSWTFTPTTTRKLEGSTRLSIVIAVPRQRIGSMSVTIDAAVAEGRFRKRRVPLQGALNDAPGNVHF